MPTERRIQRMRDVLERRQPDLAVMLENVHDPHNAAAIFRTCDGFGVGEIHLLYTYEEFPRLSSRVTRKIERWQMVVEHSDAASAVDALHARGMRVYATAVGPDAEGHPPRSYLDVDWTRPSAVVFGNEHRGCSEELIGLADERVTIAMQGFAESFNVSVSAAIFLAEAHRQRLAAGMCEPSWSEAKEAQLRAWIEAEQSR